MLSYSGGRAATLLWLIRPHRVYGHSGPHKSYGSGQNRSGHLAVLTEPTGVKVAQHVVQIRPDHN